MKAGTRSIFRPEALRRYAQSKEQAVLPHYIRPPLFVCLWLLLGLFVAAGGLALNVHMPVYVTGSAMIVEQIGNADAQNDSMMVVAFVPSQYLDRLQAGQTAWLNLGAERIGQPIMAVEPEIMSPAAIQQRFHPGIGSTQPSAVVIARLEGLPAGLSPATYAGAIYPVEIEIGSRSMLSFYR